jgi:hypothetical protein
MTASASQVGGAEREQGAGPVHRLGDRGRLAQAQLAQPADEAHHRLREGASRSGHVLGDDLLLQRRGGVVDVEEEAASAQGLGQLARRVGGEHHERAVGRR